MNLEEFVTLTLVQIRRGIAGANAQLADPDPAKRAATFLLPQPASKEGFIEFDVAVTVSVAATAGTEAKAGIKVVEGSVQGKLEGSREQVSRVRFSVITIR